MRYLHSIPAVERVILIPPQAMTTAEMHNRLVIVLSYDPKGQCIDKKWCSFPSEGLDEVTSSFDTLLTQYCALGDLLRQRSLRDADKSTRTTTVDTMPPIVLAPVCKLAQLFP